MTDLVATTFIALRSRFFDDRGRPRPFALRDKLNTQDDPFDEFLSTDVLAKLPAIACAKATGPLITPDMVLYRAESFGDRNANELILNPNHIIAMEVKKLQRTAQGRVARASGLDYNTTPPCGQVRVYDAVGTAVDIRGFYLFVCLEDTPDDSGLTICTALALVDGNLLNEDFELYLAVTGEREKRIGLGTYGDGADRDRPMLIFANPLGAAELDHAATLACVLSNSTLSDQGLSLIYEIERTAPNNSLRRFNCYRVSADVARHGRVKVLRDPFPTPHRETRTRPRGHFRLPFEVPPLS